MITFQAFKLIFTSPTSAHEVSADEHLETRNRQRQTRSSTDKSTRSHVASLIGMCSVKPRAIAYAAVQVIWDRDCGDITDEILQLRFALSSLTSWRVIDGDFDANMFYQNIVDYFEAPLGPLAKTQVQELLLWWDRKAFGFNREIARPRDIVVSLSVARLANQRTVAEVAVPVHVARASGY
ncbi:hypothetical protein JVU11DRAFT_9028 [Chiua virens]|nr:hypothetical protein JVU11DRAFT_9028 [Chiua virens]